MTEIINTLTVGPVLPATCFLGFMLAWSLLAILGTVDLDLPGGGDIDVDIDLDLDSPAGVGAADGLAVIALRWLNLKSVPLVLWLGTFAVVWWFLSATLWSLIDSRFVEQPGFLVSAVLLTKNLLIAIGLTKLLTGPMRGWFITEQINAGTLVGEECEVSSLEATTKFGQVKYKTDGSPLLLNVRTDGPTLVRGTRVWITHYDAKRRMYIVSPTGTDAVPELTSDNLTDTAANRTES